MKKLLLQLTLLLGIANVFSQSDIAGPFLGHQRLPGRYVGWSPVGAEMFSVPD